MIAGSTVLTRTPGASSWLKVSAIRATRTLRPRKVQSPHLRESADRHRHCGLVAVK